MWTTLALVAALSLAPGQSGQLTLSNVHSTYGFLGAERASPKFIPGDTFFVSFNIDGVKVDPSGEVLYSMSMEVNNSQGKSIYKQDPRDLTAFNSLGGSRLPAFAHVEIGLDQPPGEYTLSVTVVDRSTKSKQVLTSKFEVLPKAFGIVRLQTSMDPQGNMPAPSIGVTGQSVWVNFAAIGFERDKAKKQPDVGVEMRLLDESGKPTLAKAYTGEVTGANSVPAEVQALPMQFLLALNRSGKFVVELQATDRISKKTTKLSFPITVQESTK
jgi:hypothetical protein